MLAAPSGRPHPTAAGASIRYSRARSMSSGLSPPARSSPCTAPRHWRRPSPWRSRPGTEEYGLEPGDPVVAQEGRLARAGSRWTGSAHRCRPARHAGVEDARGDARPAGPRAGAVGDRRRRGLSAAPGRAARAAAAGAGHPGPRPDGFAPAARSLMWARRRPHPRGRRLAGGRARRAPPLAQGWRTRGRHHSACGPRRRGAGADHRRSARRSSLTPLAGEFSEPRARSRHGRDVAAARGPPPEARRHGRDLRRRHAGGHARGRRRARQPPAHDRAHPLKPSFYQDSVALMGVARELRGGAGVQEAAALMGTPANRELMEQAGLLTAEAAAAGPNDLVVVVRADSEAAADGRPRARRVAPHRAPARESRRRPPAAAHAGQRAPAARGRQPGADLGARPLRGGGGAQGAHSAASTSCSSATT